MIRGPGQAQIWVGLHICAKPVGPGPDDPQIDPCSALAKFVWKIGYGRIARGVEDDGLASGEHIVR